MNVVIYEISSGSQVGEYRVNAAGQNYEPSEEDHFKLAYRCLVDDGLANGKAFGDFRYVATA